MLNGLREDLIKVISNYMEIDQATLECSLCPDDCEVALVINIPIVKMKRDYAANR